MEDEVSNSIRIAVVVWMTGALVNIVAGILIMSLGVLTDYSGKYSDAIVYTTESSITSSVKDESQSGAIIYARINSSINSIDAVKIGDTFIYKYDDPSCQGLMSLMTVNKNTRYKVVVTNGELISTLKTVILTEVP